MNYKNVFASSKAAIDLASIMVGIIVIGLIGGVIAATVFAVIPWTQDNVAKEGLRALAQAQNVHTGMVADNQIAGSLVSAPVSSVPIEGQKFGSVERLVELGYLPKNEVLSLTLGIDDNCYIAAAKSASGAIFYNASDSSTIYKVENNSTPDVAWCGVFPIALEGVDSGSGGSTPDDSEGRYESITLSLTATREGGLTPIEAAFSCWRDGGQETCEIQMIPFDNSTAQETSDAKAALAPHEAWAYKTIRAALDNCSFADNDCVQASLNAAAEQKFPAAEKIYVGDEFLVSVFGSPYNY